MQKKVHTDTLDWEMFSTDCTLAPQPDYNITSLLKSLQPQMRERAAAAWICEWEKQGRPNMGTKSGNLVEIKEP